MRASVVFVLSAAVSGLSAQTAIEYGATAGKAAAIAAGVGTAIKGTFGTASKRLEQSKNSSTAAPAPTRRLDEANARALADAAAGSTSSNRRSAVSVRAAGPATQAVAPPPTGAQAAILRVSQPLPPPKEPTVIDPSALKEGMPRAELDALGTPAMSISDAEGETRIYRTAKGSVTVMVRDGRIAGIQL